MMGICIWWRLRLNRSWHLLAILAAIWILRHFILVPLLVILWTKLSWLVATTWYLLLILAVYWPSWRSIFWARPSFCCTLRVLHRVVSSTIPFHELLTISILVDWLKWTKCFWLMHPVWVRAVYILSLWWRIATDMGHVASLVVGIILLVKIWSLLHFNSAWSLIDAIFLRILGNLFLDVSWRMLVGVQLWKCRLLSKCPSLLVRKHDRLTCSIFRRTHTLSLWYRLSVMRFENATYHLLTLCRNTSSWWDQSLAWVLWTNIVILEAFLAPTCTRSLKIVASFKTLWPLLSTMIVLVSWYDLQLIPVLYSICITSYLNSSNISYTKRGKLTALFS